MKLSFTTPHPLWPAHTSRSVKPKPQGGDIVIEIERKLDATAQSWKLTVRLCETASHCSR